MKSTPKPSVYIETSIVSYLTARPSRDVVAAAHQQLTLAWWDTCRHLYELYISQAVWDEAARGDRKQRGDGLSQLRISQVSR